MYGNCAPSLRAIAVRILSQTTSSSACERNWSTFALIHTKQRNRLVYSKLEQLVYCYYNMKLKLRDMAAEKDKVNETNFIDLLQVPAEARDDNENFFFEWVRPAYLDDDEGNLDPQIASHARDMGINVEQVIREEVGIDRGVTVSSSSDDQRISDGNSGGKDDGDDGDDGDEGGGWDSGARGWDAGVTCWNASAAGWNAHAGNFDQNRGRQHGGASQIDEDSLNMTLFSMSMDTKNGSLGDSQTMSGSHVPYYGSCRIFDYPSPQMSYAIPMLVDQQYLPSWSVALTRESLCHVVLWLHACRYCSLSFGVTSTLRASAFTSFCKESKNSGIDLITRHRFVELFIYAIETCDKENADRIEFILRRSSQTSAPITQPEALNVDYSIAHLEFQPSYSNPNVSSVNTRPEMSKTVDTSRGGRFAPKDSLSTELKIYFQLFKFKDVPKKRQTHLLRFSTNQPHAFDSEVNTVTIQEIESL
ncbi:hypothetical protein Dsin_005423 [Dipteronia sinensis]|uniref:HAT C-terminal dimerisation domain-containing protein n=1 Tax=Dipteronia sinensis TaxID=43782 RepID=A0AAE0EEP1_9ROSI|nr:hypothetical protein Dsin_005423 [Dipteronia sinensis]